MSIVTAIGQLMRACGFLTQNMNANKLNKSFDSRKWNIRVQFCKNLYFQLVVTAAHEDRPMHGRNAKQFISNLTLVDFTILMLFYGVVILNFCGKLNFL